LRERQCVRFLLPQDTPAGFNETARPLMEPFFPKTTTDSLGNPALDYIRYGDTAANSAVADSFSARWVQGTPIVRRHYFALLIPSRLSKRQAGRQPEAERAPREELSRRRGKFAASRLTAGGDGRSSEISPRHVDPGIFKGIGDRSRD